MLQQSPSNAVIWGFGPVGGAVTVKTSIMTNYVSGIVQSDGTWQVTGVIDGTSILFLLFTLSLSHSSRSLSLDCAPSSDCIVCARDCVCDSQQQPEHLLD